MLGPKLTDQMRPHQGKNRPHQGINRGFNTKPNKNDGLYTRELIPIFEHAMDVKIWPLMRIREMISFKIICTDNVHEYFAYNSSCHLII